MSNISVDSCRVSSQLTVHKTDDAIGFVSTIMENGIVYSQSTVIWLEDIKVVFLNAEKEVMFNYLYVVLKEGYTVESISDKVNACLEEYQRPVEIIQIDKRPFFHFKTNRIGLMRELKAESAS